MNLNLKNPIVFFDLETTGINTSRDRIVEAAFLKIMPNGEKISWVKKINPGIPIPAETTAIHGISDEDVKEAPTFKSVAKNLHKYLEGCDLGGFSIIRFDVPILVEEFLRADVNFDIGNRKMVDAQRIFHLMEPRTLTAAYKFFCGKDLVDAHSAEADNLATYEVLNAQIKHYEGRQIKDKNGNLFTPVSPEVKDLHELTFQKMVDLAGRLAYNSKDEVVFNFGKYKSKPVLDVFAKDPSYYDWMMRGDFPLNTKQKLTELKISQIKLG